MKCQQCDRPAIYHITDLTGPELVELHLCEKHVQEYLMRESEKKQQVPATMAGVLASQFSKLKDIQAADLQVSCPVCGIDFKEFRSVGRLGCAHDYVAFGQILRSIIANIHGALQHRGKHPKRGAQGTEELSELIQLRRQMRAAIEREDYEAASRLRDRIRELQRKAQDR